MKIGIRRSEPQKALHMKKKTGVTVVGMGGCLLPMQEQAKTQTPACLPLCPTVLSHHLSLQAAQEKKESYFFLPKHASFLLYLSTHKESRLPWRRKERHHFYTEQERLSGSGALLHTPF